MPDLDFQITGAKAVADGLTPLVEFQLAVKELSGATPIKSVTLHMQIQIQSPQRAYNPQERSRLFDLFGATSDWGNTLRNRLWTTADTNIGAFSGSTTAAFHIPCTFDLSIASAKYFYALEEGVVPLIFLFSGTIFYETATGVLQATPISWNKESVFNIPVRLWREIMDKHFPDAAWIYLRRDIFDRLYALKRNRGDASWEQTIQWLLATAEPASTEMTA